MTATPWRDRIDRDLLVLLVVVATLLAFRSIVDPDLPGHLAYGLVHLEGGQLQGTDPYSYTAHGEPWINHEWAFEWTIAAAYSTLGTTGLLLLQGLAWTATAVLVVRLVRRGTTDFPAAAGLFAAYVALAYPSISVRPQLVTFVSFALLVTLLERARAGHPRGLLAVPVLVAVWTNFHGGFLAGLGVLGAYSAGLALDALARRPVHGPQGDAPLPPRTAALAAGMTALATLATLLNPYGADLHRWLGWSLSVPNQNITEWRAVELDAQGVTYGVVLLVVVAALLAQGWRRVPLAHALPLAATAVLALRHTRHVPFFVVLACAAAAGPLAALYRRALPRDPEDLTEAQHRGLRRLALVLGLLAFAWRFGLEDVRLRLSPEQESRWPTGAIAHVDSLLRAEREAGRPPRNALVFFDWAQLAIWRWHPQLRVHYDGRHRTVFPLEVEHEHFAFLGLDAPGDWRAAIAARPTDLVLVPVDRTADVRMRQAPGWRLAYVDGVAALYLRGAGGPPVVGPDRPPPIAFETRLGE